MLMQNGLSDVHSTVQTANNPARDDMTDNPANALQVSLLAGLRDLRTFRREIPAELPGTPYETPHWLNAWACTLGKKRRIEALTAIARLGGKTVAVLPLALERTMGIRRLSLLGHQNGNQNAGCWDADFYASVTPDQIHTFLEDICREARADLLTLENVPEVWQGRKHPMVLETATPSPSPVFVRSLSSDFENLYCDTHSKSSRKNLSRKQRHLQALGGYKAVKAETPEDLRAGLAAFLGQRAKRAAEAGIPNVFSDPAARDFLERLLGLGSAEPESGTAERSLDLWYLETGGAIRATSLCAERSGTIYTYSNSIAHDELMQYSPGIVLVKEIVEYACGAPDLNSLDFGLGEERYKLAWAEPAPLRDSLYAATWKGRLLGDLDLVKTKAKAAIRNSRTLWPLVRRFRKWRAGAGKSES